MANGFVHIELNTTDPKAAKSFYGRLFNWQLEDMDMGGGATYTLIKPGEGPGGGLMQHPMAGAPSMWLTYINVDNLTASTEKARTLGAQVLKDATEVPNMGSFSILSDPTGAVFALWQAKK